MSRDVNAWRAPRRARFMRMIDAKSQQDIKRQRGDG
jgi:hypothetical protein